MTTVQTVSDFREHTTTKPLLKTIAWVGLLAGTLDILSACLQAYIVRGTSPETVLRYIASGAFGKAAFTGGWGMALTGLLFTAIVYGIFIFVVMNMVVLPLTKIQRASFQIDKAAIAAGILIVAIGLPLSFFARRFYQHSHGNNHTV
jgi:hypothetical protein